MQKYHLKIIAAYTTLAGSNAYKYEPEDKKAFIDNTVKKSQIKANCSANPDDKLMTLSTCAYEYDGARYVIIGKLIPWQ